MEDLNILNIPAYQRKKSLDAKAKKTTQRARKPVLGKTKERPAKSRLKMTIEELSVQENIVPTRDFVMPESMIEKSELETREMKVCGFCEGYFDKINVAIIKLTTTLRKGDQIIFEKNDGLFEQTVTSMQIDRKEISYARPGADIGMKVAMNPKVGAPVYKVI